MIQERARDLPRPSRGQLEQSRDQGVTREDICMSDLPLTHPHSDQINRMAFRICRHLSRSWERIPSFLAMSRPAGVFQLPHIVLDAVFLDMLVASGGSDVGRGGPAGRGHQIRQCSLWALAAATSNFPLAS